MSIDKSALISTLLDALTSAALPNMSEKEYEVATKEVGFDKNTMNYKKFIDFKMTKANLALEKAKEEGIIPKNL